MNRAENPNDSIVRVWQDMPDNKLVGSAFFVSPSIVLTARHVVRDAESGRMRENLYSRLVRGRNRVDIDSRRVHCDSDFDIG